MIKIKARASLFSKKKVEATQGVATLRLESDKRKNNALWEFVKAKANLTALSISVYI